MRTEYSKTSVVILIFFGGLGYAVLQGIGYFNHTYYSLFQEGTGFDDVQIGTLMSIIGILALIGYAFGGILADKFNIKMLMILSHTMGFIVAFAMAMRPGYSIMLILQTLISIFCIFTYWSAMALFVRSLGGVENEGKLYGFFYMACGIGGAVTGFIATAIIARTDAVTGYRSLLFLYAGLNLLVAIIIGIFYKTPDKSSLSEDDKFQLKYVLDVLKMPEIWLLGIAGFAGYLINVITSYFNPLLTTSFGVSVGTMTLLATIRSYIVRLSINPISGIVIDKMKGSLSLMRTMLICMLVAVGIVMVLPWDPNYKVIAIAIMITLAIIYNFLSPTWFTPLTDIGIPDKMRGTAVGITNAIIFSSDAFMYNVAGHMIDANGTQGYTMLFGMIGAFAIVGIICVVVLKKRIAAKKAAA